MRKKILLIILDGLGDRPIKEFGYKTPLEIAMTPNFDFLAKNGICGQIIPCFQKFPSSKDTHLTLFGYNLKKWSMGRGVFEAIGIGMNLKKEDVALRANMATVGEDMKIIDRRAGRISYKTPLIKTLKGLKIEKVKFFFGEGISHRLALVIRGKNLSDKISDGDLHKINIVAPKIYPLDKSASAKFTAKVLNKFLEISHWILKNHPLNKRRKKRGKLPANYILLREAGKVKKIPSFQKKWGWKACCVAGGIVYKGIAKILKMELISVKGATGKANTNLKGKFQVAKNSFKKYDFCYLHIKATDNFSHDGDYLGKKKFIEKVDKYLPSLFGLKNTLIIITGDHSTPCQIKNHTSDPLPVLIFGGQKDNVSHFSEKDCRQGKLNKIKSINFLKMLKKIC